MERVVILLFPSNELRSHFITALSITDYTLHQRKPVLYCRLAKESIERAVKSFDAKDISYDHQEKDNWGFEASDAMFWD